MDSSIVGIGKLKVFPSKDFEDEIPILSFIVKKRDNLYVSICLQLQIERIRNRSGRGKRQYEKYVF